MELFFWREIPYMDLNHSIYVPSSRLYFITPLCSTKRPTAYTVEWLILDKTGASSPRCTWKAKCPNQFSMHKSQWINNYESYSVRKLPESLKSSIMWSFSIAWSKFPLKQSKSNFLFLECTNWVSNKNK